MVVGRELGSSTWNELQNLLERQLPGSGATLLVPVGSTEQHGPHLPLDTDTRIAQALAGELAARRGAWAVAPAVAYGASGEHQSFAGTISIGTETLTRLLVEYGRSACCWAQRVVFVNGHGGNTSAMAQAVRLLRSEARDVAWVPCAVAGADAHAGHTETSLLLHLSPESVRLDRAQSGNTAPLAQLLPAMRAGGVAAVSAVGVLGDPTTATAAEGRRFFGEMADAALAAITSWAPGPDGMLR
ncbi:mycofactocin biosynthesis peptidyl-dipeptidase MftE [Mycolicibacter hiberniae]|uniref:Putative mycofactocin system creatinine amidohydrolase family protein MftE n=1 Tax=Mycolicibacter hiberniae TaxID=29314 RepID=A0A7I7X3V5_9MYCO|nr:mycofactocin biosynthesis peptidyl-dipeptidase MftE [Mycolicibacter hiberniae]MCV7084575.1 mycofactocin biosynthesis peptidyl-dipeptidase MftE [Mycolicibacter hiberniae]ORV66515.1 mycofactocin system creatininase [Mycolicibacter hiberniae]BBZ24356.1 putative mycofactocin system creatinine amidohydrolase family protein MftE [Mycolicibacter hiberniae]